MAERQPVAAQVAVVQHLLQQRAVAVASSVRLKLQVDLACSKVGNGPRLRNHSRAVFLLLFSATIRSLHSQGTSVPKFGM